MRIRRNLRLLHCFLRRYLLLQLGLLIAVWWGSDALVRQFHLALPGPVLGIFVLLGLLFSRILPVSCLRRSVNLLMANLMLLFVPPMLSLRDHPELLSATGMGLIGIVLVGTLVVMCGTALVVERIVRHSETMLRRSEANAV